jgi:ferredoxin
MSGDDLEGSSLASDRSGAGLAVHIDHGMCSGTRNCERHYAELFVVDGGKSWLREDVDDSRPLEGEQT